MPRSRFFSYLIISIKLIISVVCNPIKVLEKGILPLETSSVAIQFYLDLENEDKLDACYLHSKPNKCCLINDDDVDCDTVNLVGRHDELLRPKDRTTFLFFYVTMFQLNHEGYCNVELAYRCGLSPASKTEEIRIPFDTRLFKKETQYLLQNYKSQKTTKCKFSDEDPLDECRPVNCDFKYAGVKPFYNKNEDKCVEAAQCIADPYKSLPDVVYDPSSNTCKDLDHSLSVIDIYAINSGLGTVIKPDEIDDSDKASLVIYKPNCSTISQNVQFLKDLITGKLNPIKGYNVDFKRSCNDAVISIFSCIVGISTVIVLFVCCTNAVFIIVREWESGNLYKTVENFKDRMKKHEVTDVESDERLSSVNREIKNKLLKEVIVSDLPMELRDSVVDICERIGREVRWKKRYRMIDDGSDINLKPVNESSDTSTTSDLDVSEKERILKSK